MRISLALGDPAVRLAQVPETGEQPVEKSPLGSPYPHDAGQEAVHEVAQQGADQGPRQSAAEEADDSADDLAPPVAGYAETLD